MLDLNKLEENFKKLFESESEDSFNKWLHEKKQNEILNLLGNGHLDELKGSIGKITPVEPRVLILINSSSGQVPYLNAQYAMAV